MNGAASEFLSVRETARRLAVHENTVRAYAKRGLLPDARVPGTSFYRFRASDVERLRTQRGAPAVSLAAERRTASPEYATASQLAQWPQTNAREAQDRLPELVRRLLFETPGAGQISIRTRDGVALAGKDGVANLEGPTQLLPAGQICFEFGTDKDSKRKATKDYNGRKAEASHDVTFVFATVRRWQGKDSWAADRRAERLFKDVLVLDADDLEAWLQIAPSTHLWISETLGLRPQDALTLETWWDRFSAATEPNLPLKLFIAGRAKEAQRLRSLLGDEPRVISIQTEWVDDALGFLQACLPPDDNSSKPGAVTIVRSRAVWDRTVALPGPGILVPVFDNADVARALASGRHVVSIVDSAAAVRRSVDIRLPRVSRNEAADAFRAEDVEWGHADRLAVLARRSMPALARRISRSPRVQKPTWSRPPLADTLAALMLASSWTDIPEDLHVLGELAAIPSVDLQRAIADASRGSDPAIRNVRNVFVFTSLEEAFLEFGYRVSTSLASRWAEIATNVLLDPDPYDGLASHERIAAQMKGQRRTYSAALRRGIADSLALAGAIEPMPSANHASSVADRVVGDVLRQVTSGSERHTWGAIADVLPLLAEAAPETFLSALEDDLASSEPTVGRLFQAIDDSLALGPSGQQHHLLWALEVLCWSPHHIVRATQVLTELCRYDLPKNSGNNPLASMSTVLCGWIRHTGADLDTRLQALDACRIVSATTAWALLKALWPDSNAWVSPPSEPRYQLWKPPSNRMPSSEWFAFATKLVDRALEWIKADRAALPWLVEALTTVGPDEANRIIEFLEVEASHDHLDEDVRLALFEQVRKTAAQHEQFQNADWAMPAERCARLHNLAELLQPVDDLRRLAYLFNWHPDLLGAELNEYEHYRTALEAKRREALDLLFMRPDAWAQLAAVAARAGAPTQVGWALSTYEPVDALDAMLEWLASDSTALQDAAATWVRSHLAANGPADLRRALERSDVGSAALKRFVLNVPTESRFWETFREFTDAEELFWSEAPFEAVPREDLTDAIELLLERARAWSAIAVTSNGIVTPTADQDNHLPSAALVLSVLRAAITQDPVQAGISQMTGYYVGTLLDHLAAADVSVADLASLEFAYFRLAENYREPRALNQALASDPAVFVDLVRRTFHGANETGRQSRNADPLAEHAWWVLRGWHGFPGRQEDDTIDPGEMHEWVKQARLRLSDLDRADIGDELIGQSFAQAPVDADGIWPPVPVRDLIESIGSRNLENGVIIGRLNSRGVTWRGAYDGGSQERTLTELHKQWSLGVQVHWPRTARVLRAIAQSYERDAVREDERAQLDQDLD
ncbi:helix-turn-helix domain-containing protein [Gordonia sputi]|uniref:helix-turn-helix domain-containing protein n=1 Tax=Gordonia sputi TaxID=36823 RepID=UPI0020445A0C|nr:helix-turn-helix domain-containing protein [Gordonia sputi]MCM3896193.1 helix-turn-helix domain-containing protein [Gordonia sputi]